MEQIVDNSFAIIGGATKSGTTSLFKYLKDHPEVSGSSLKETRFFLDIDYPVPAIHHYNGSLSKYFEFFKQISKDQLLLEATPDYLYSLGTPERIKSKISNCKLVFILRNPVDRFISWYKFSKQNNSIPSDTSLGDFFKMQVDDEKNYYEQHRMVLMQGKYSEYLNNYFECFDPEKIYVCYLEDLEADPYQFMNKICEFLHIESGFYKDYSFIAQNVTIDVKNQNLHQIYRKLSALIRKNVHKNVVAHGLLKKMKKSLIPFYLKANEREEKDRVEFYKDEMRPLIDYYSEELERYKERYRVLLHA
ncbi:MAG: sulfotransferase domain-containing protein [Cyclobacteriaceae bacterium]|nr:sulfotransferase domain-containing protein [Cyclobacteriaceae bacterium]